jgi:hypothetical protein
MLPTRWFTSLHCYTSEFLCTKAFFSSRSTTRCVKDRLLRLLSFSLRSLVLFLRDERLRFIVGVERLSLSPGSSNNDVRDADKEFFGRNGGCSTFSTTGFARDKQLARKESSSTPPQVSKTPSAKRTNICARVSYWSSWERVKLSHI